MILIVVGALAINLTIAVAALGYVLISDTKTDATLLTAFVGLTGTLAGYFGGMLSRTTPATSSTSSEQKPSGSVTVPEQKLETS